MFSSDILYVQDKKETDRGKGKDTKPIALSPLIRKANAFSGLFPLDFAYICWLYVGHMTILAVRHTGKRNKIVMINLEQSGPIAWNWHFSFPNKIWFKKEGE